MTRQTSAPPVRVLGVGLATAAGRGWAALKAALEDGRPLPSPDLSAEALLFEALEDMNLGPLPQDAGLIFATASGALAGDWARWHVEALAGAPSPPPSRPRQAPGDALAARLGVLGPRANVSLACASGTAALGVALDWLQAGRARVVVVAAVDRVCPFVSSGFEALKLVDPQGCRPLTPGSRGFHLGAAAAILVLAVGEGGVQLSGAASAQDAWHPLTPHPEGRGLIDAARLALARAGGPAAQLVSIHGTGTPANDQAEAAALLALFGEDRPPLQALKPVLGHTMGAAGLVEAAALVLSLGDSQPVGWPESRVLAEAPRTGISWSMAFGGVNAAVVFSLEPGAGLPVPPPVAVVTQRATVAEVQASPSGEDPSHVAARRALLDLAPPPDAGVILSAPRGSILADLRHHARLVGEGPALVSPRTFAATVPGAPLMGPGVTLGLRGPVMALLDPPEVALALAEDWLRLGRCEAVVVVLLEVRGEDLTGEGAWARAETRLLGVG
ncbi:MAG: hypothetical protein IPO67_27535 [Deltaproteobacteria bacterium]|nr:hypothetical protein [Deltaproteobacteria bacterium]